MQGLAQVLAPQAILLDAEISNATGLFESVAHLWQEHVGVAAVEVVARLSARERLGTTGLGKGVAIPHARLAGLDRPLAAFVRTRLPIDFDAPDGEPVALFFVLLAPQRDATKHLEILADVAERFSNAQFRERIAMLPIAEEVRQLFVHWRSPIPRVRSAS
jgi:PTS system nitrogen regulatory IIA component